MTLTGSDQASHASKPTEGAVLGARTEGADQTESPITKAAIETWSPQSLNTSNLGDRSVVANTGFVDLSDQSFWGAAGARSQEGQRLRDGVQMAALGNPTELPQRPGQEQLPDGRFHAMSPETTKRFKELAGSLNNGELSGLGRYIGDMNHQITWNPEKGADMQEGFKNILNGFKTLGIDARGVEGGMRITLKDGQSVTIDASGHPNLKGAELEKFQKSLKEAINVGPQEKGKGEKEGDGISDKTSQRLDRIEDGIRKGDLSGLTSAIKDIGDKTNSAKPGAAGNKERAEGAELQKALGYLGAEYSTKDVDVQYDPKSNTMSITLPNEKGEMQTLQIDKYGQPSMKGEQLQQFMKRWNYYLKNPGETITT